MTFEEARAGFPMLERVAYLNAGTFGPLARETAEAMAAEARHDLEEGRFGKEWFEDVLARREELRAEIGALVGVGAEHVALTSSTTDGCNIVLAGLGLGRDDEVVTTSDEHFGLLGPLHASGARVVVAAPEPDAILAAVTPRTRLLALSHVLWTTGVVLPVEELKERSGLPVLVDGAQSVGAIPVDASRADFTTVSGQKWLCGPDATGALVVTDPGRLRIASPSYFSQSAYEPTGDFEPRPGAARFEPGWHSSGQLAGLLTALRVPPAWRWERGREIAARCRERLATRVQVVTPAGQAGLVSFRVEGGTPAEAAARLTEVGVVVRDIPHTEFVRASCGWWTSDEDVERLVAAL